MTKYDGSNYENKEETVALPTVLAPFVPVGRARRKKLFYFKY